MPASLTVGCTAPIREMPTETMRRLRRKSTGDLSQTYMKWVVCNLPTGMGSASRVPGASRGSTHLAELNCQAYLRAMPPGCGFYLDAPDTQVQSRTALSSVGLNKCFLFAAAPYKRPKSLPLEPSQLPPDATP